MTNLDNLIARRRQLLAEAALDVLGPPWVSVCVSTGEVFDASPEHTELLRRAAALKAQAHQRKD